MSHTNVIDTYVLPQPMHAFRVQIIRKDSTTLFCSRDREGPNTSEHVCNNILWLEQLYKTIVFGV